MAGEKLLVIAPDIELLKNLSEELLTPHGFKPLLAKGQDEGVNIAIAESPHIMLLNLPHDEATRLLRRMAQADCSIPSILMLDQEPAFIAAELLRLNVRDYVIHPFTTEEALQAIHRTLGQNAQSVKDQPPTQDRVTLNRELKQRIKELNVLLGVGRSVSSSLDLDTVLKRVTEAAVFITGAEVGHLLLLDVETGDFRLRAVQNWGERQAQSLNRRVDGNVVGRVVSTGQPLLLDRDSSQNVVVDTGYMAKSLLFVPLKVNGRVIGALGVTNQVSDVRFSRTHLRRLSALAEVLATAVENARQYSELHSRFTRRVREFATLQAVADQMGAVTDFDVGAQLALSLALKATNAEAGVLAWAGGGWKHLDLYISQGSLGELVVNHHSGATSERWWDEESLRKVIETGQPILNGNLDNSRNGGGSHSRSQLAVPMRRGKRIIGAINVESSSPDAFTQDDLQFVLSVADQVAIALEGAVLQENANTGQEHLSLLMEAVDNAVWVVDADLCLMAQNEAACEMLGWSVNEAIARSHYEMMSSKTSSADGLCQILGQVMEEGQPISFPVGDCAADDGVLLETKHGRSILIKGRALPLVEDGRVAGAICAFREVRSEKSDEHIRFEFANMASHLLRSPLSFIQASIDLMLNSELDAGEQRVMLEKMLEQSQRIRQFIKDLLEMSRLETGVVRVYPEPVVLPPLIERVLDLIRPEEPRYVFSFDAPGTFPIVAADPGKTELILLSLLRSAMGRCPNGGCIKIELEARTSEAIISITDDGETISPRLLNRIFSQYYPVDDDGDKMPSTYQIGLYTTKRLITLQKGYVWAESQLGKGTRLGFSLPVWGVSHDS